MLSYVQVAESYITNLLVSVQLPLQQSVKQAILGGDEDLLWLLYELPNSLVHSQNVSSLSFNGSFLSNQGLKSLIGQQVSVWIDECKLEIIILQLREGLLVDEEKLSNWIVSGFHVLVKLLLNVVPSWLCHYGLKTYRNAMERLDLTSSPLASS